MKTFVASEIERFLESVDSFLTQPDRVVVIGGSAAALHYGVQRATIDIDTFNRVGIALAVACTKARGETGLDIPVQHSAVADGPLDFESRLIRVLPGTHRLVVQVPERHDLVLMKTVRGYEHDLETIEAIHADTPLDLDLLVQRFQFEMGHVIGHPRRFRGNFLAMIERLFPEHIASVEGRLGIKAGS